MKCSCRIGFARTILEANERAAGFFAGTRLRGRLRFGVSEDFVLTRLPELLATFRREHPEVDLELTVELSGTLHRLLGAGRHCTRLIHFGPALLLVLCCRRRLDGLADLWA